ncbi:hypothetical protein LOC71_17595 [Rhodopirellula sp. JC740]|uniref:Uncharacterized protein n=1 Tax=Rhodopirellula halodulae TaxID=2894198 RepID=A0ABS8NKN7_9BACT|nr:hypothetical protein [Rhodopirellula sp. JC740]MCC9644100.1 hypothetical protein [Rhodopirellula sp. JC740]
MNEQTWKRDATNMKAFRWTRGLAAFAKGPMTALLLAALCLQIHADDTSDTSPAATSPDAAETAPASSRGDLILVVGAAGLPEYESQFAAWAKTWESIAEQSELNLSRIGVDAPAKTEVPDASIPNDLERLKQTIDSLTPDSPRPVWITLIGHGTFARGDAKFNLRGPDVSAKQLGEWLAVLNRPIVIINNASSSGPFINELSGNDRIVVTATKSGNEQNFARFGQYFAEALSSLESDSDHDEAVSIQEAFVRASKAVELFYEGQDRIATEHALLDDNGDGLGTQAKDIRKQAVSAEQLAKVDGKEASRMTIAPVANSLRWTDDQLQRRDELEARLDALRLQRLSNPNESDNQSFAELEAILVPLAELYHEVESNSPP